MDQNLKTEATEIINTGVMLGLIKSSARFELISFASKSQKELMMLKSVLVEGRKCLVNQFDTYAKDGTLEELKTRDVSYFNRLWLAKFNKLPKQS